MTTENPTTKAKLLAKLLEIEEKKDVTVLFACEAGSRSWGFASPDSDHDLRFIYVHRLPWYMTITPGKDCMVIPSSTDSIDIVGWDLRKAMGLMMASNPSLIEWFQSPTVYVTSQFHLRMREMVDQLFSVTRCWWHCRSLAKKDFMKDFEVNTINQKSYLHIVRSLLMCRYLDKNQAIAPVVLKDLVEKTMDVQTESEMIGLITGLSVKKSSTRGQLIGPRIPAIDRFIMRELSFSPPAPVFTPKDNFKEQADELFFGTVKFYDKAYQP